MDTSKPFEDSHKEELDEVERQPDFLCTCTCVCVTGHSNHREGVRIVVRRPYGRSTWREDPVGLLVSRTETTMRLISSEFFVFFFFLEKTVNNLFVFWRHLSFSFPLSLCLYLCRFHTSESSISFPFSLLCSPRSFSLSLHFLLLSFHLNYEKVELIFLFSLSTKTCFLYTLKLLVTRLHSGMRRFMYSRLKMSLFT